jgi:hypothetical protein
MSKAKELSELGDAVTVDSGNVGIGTTPTQKLDVRNDGAGGIAVIGVRGGTSGAGAINISGDGTTYGSTSFDLIQNASAAYVYQRANLPLIFGTNATERMRIDSSGNLLVGKTTTSFSTAGSRLTPDGGGQFVVDGAACLEVNRLSSDGDLSAFYKAGTKVGSISSISTGDTSYNSVNGTISLGGDQSNHIQVLTSTATGAPRLQPSADNAVDLGFSGRRFDDIFATNGTIQTSDRNDKQDEADLSDAETRVAVAAKGLLKKFRWKSAVEEKGDEARVHFGIIAQDLQDAFTAEGLDASDYAMFINSEWWESYTDVPAIEAQEAVLDEDGNVVTEAVEAKEAYTRTDTYETEAEAPEGAIKKQRMGVRYSELLAFIIAGI